MTKRRLLVALLLALFITSPTYAGFREVERALESRLGSPMYGPLFTIVRIVTWVAHPKGVHDIRLTVFEKKGRDIDGKEIEALLAREAPAGFRPLVRTRSRDGEWAFIYARPRGDQRIELFLVTHDNENTVLAQVDVEPEVIARELNHPKKMGTSIASR